MTTPTDAGLLPCPFCGAAAHFEIDEGRWEWVECESCGMQGNRSASLMEDCKPKLREEWNRRAPQAGAGGEPVDWIGASSHHLLAPPPQAVREPLTPREYNQIPELCAIAPSLYESVVRGIERAHGITKGGQHGN